MLTVESRNIIEGLLVKLGVNRIPNSSKEEELWYELRVKAVADVMFVVFEQGYRKGKGVV